MTCYAYQLVYPSRTAVVDTAMDEKTARSEVPVKMYDAAAWQRVQKALDVADFAVVTHEHYDHIGGLLVNATGWERAIVNPQQLEHPELTKPLPYPAQKPKNVVDYQGAKAVAPGVVLVRAPGHTPGSQMVYVQRADGAELLFLGDIAWQSENLERVRERARMVTTIMGEDRHNVLQQLAALHALHAAEPKVSIVPGHDGSAVDALIAQGVLVKGFKVP
jgi:glyoxylase-like metal-dependent hydrolase (beta-lactamase superfamily II)